MSKHNKPRSATPYDDVHRTLLNDCPSLIIPVVNEVFHKNHRSSETVTLLNDTIFLNRRNGKQSKRITDTNFQIGSDRYHLECQSTADGSILYRIFEYDSQLAMQDSSMTAGSLTVHFPNTAVLYLRHTKNTPDTMEIRIRVPGDSCVFRVPILKVQNYTIDEIFEKDLLFLIPFYIFTYEKQFKEYDTNEEKLRELENEYARILGRLDVYAQEQRINEYTMGILIDMSKKVLENLARKYSNIKEGVGTVMGGKILNYPTKENFYAARAEGLKEGRAEGRRGHLGEQVKKKLKKGLSVPEIADALEESEHDIQAIIDELKMVN